MNYEEMSIEELEAKEKDLKAEYYDIDERKNEIKEEISIIKNIKKEKVNQTANAVEEQKEEVVETTEENTNEEVVSENNLEQSQTEETPLIPVVETNEVNTEPVQEEVVENVAEQPQVEETPLIPVVEVNEVNTEPVQEVHEDVVNPQTLAQTPLTPVGVEIPSAETNVEVKGESNEVYNKVDSNAARAILINKSQSDKLKKSKELNKSLVLGNTSQVKEEVQVELPKTEEAAAPVIPIQPENADDKQKQLEAMVEQLGNAKTEEEANRINEEIAVLKKSLPQAA